MNIKQLNEKLEKFEISESLNGGNIDYTDDTLKELCVKAGNTLSELKEYLGIGKTNPTKLDENTKKIYDYIVNTYNVVWDIARGIKR